MFLWRTWLLCTVFTFFHMGMHLTIPDTLGSVDDEMCPGRTCDNRLPFHWRVIDNIIISSPGGTAEYWFSALWVFRPPLRDLAYARLVTRQYIGGLFSNVPTVTDWAHTLSVVTGTVQCIPRFSNLNSPRHNMLLFLRGTQVKTGLELGRRCVSL